MSPVILPTGDLTVDPPETLVGTNADRELLPIDRTCGRPNRLVSTATNDGMPRSLEAGT